MTQMLLRNARSTLQKIVNLDEENGQRSLRVGQGL
jgi:hypothetical protein